MKPPCGRRGALAAVRRRRASWAGRRRRQTHPEYQQSFCALTGYSEQEVINNTCALYTHPDDLPKSAADREFSQGRGNLHIRETVHREKRRNHLGIRPRESPHAHRHDTPLLLAVVEDITDRAGPGGRERIGRTARQHSPNLYAVGMQLEAGKLLRGKLANPSNVTKPSGS